jgi:hypothetical protein
MKTKFHEILCKLLCVCVQKKLSFLLASQNHGHRYTNLGKNSGFLLPNLSTKKLGESLEETSLEDVSRLLFSLQKI